MLKRLRVKFIALNMATAALVLAVVFTSICVIDYQQSVVRVHQALDAAISAADDVSAGPFSTPEGALGTNPGKPLDQEEPAAGEAPTNEQPADDALQEEAGEGEASPSESPDREARSASSGEDAAATGAPPFEIGGKRGGSDPAIPVAVYAANDDGTLEAAPLQTTASIADGVLAQAAAQLKDAPEGSGSLDDVGLFYEKRMVGSTLYLAFADMSSANGWQALALTLAGVGAAALAAFFVISVFFSRWALGPVARAWEQQRRFVADASHDLKTPLTVILANTAILLEHPERSIASQSQWVESTQTEAKHMQGLVGDLLLLAQLDEGRIAPACEPLDFTDLVEGELLQFESVAFERNVALESAVADDVRVSGDASNLRRLVTTLLDNACKYAEEGGRVRVTLGADARQAKLSVTNTGAAIPAEDLPRVFDRFYRADKARTRDGSGYGLGLAIAFGIAQEHGGTLAVTSNVQDGTTFTCTLPIAPAGLPS